MVVFLLVFASAMGLLVWGGCKLSKAAKKAQMKQYMEIHKEILEEQKKDN